MTPAAERPWVAIKVSMLAHAALAAAAVLGVRDAGAQALEKDELTLGFVKLTDMAPLGVAYELGYFEDEGLFVTRSRKALPEHRSYYAYRQEILDFLAGCERAKTAASAVAAA